MLFNVNLAGLKPLYTDVSCYPKKLSEACKRANVNPAYSFDEEFLIIAICRLTLINIDELYDQH